CAKGLPSALTHCVDSGCFPGDYW
nr:immunoglobulin heavy chain junction region [Macaca mulatta]MOW94454.1 immunoglobulin heavy chain junction region [Macaca mulatta]MOW95357.1 immunoglobulin heavy chain junction region [Macaca mulatta]